MSMWVRRAPPWAGNIAEIGTTVVAGGDGNDRDGLDLVGVVAAGVARGPPFGLGVVLSCPSAST